MGCSIAMVCIHNYNCTMYYAIGMYERQSASEPEIVPLDCYQSMVLMIHGDSAVGSFNDILKAA